jgi:Cu-processing system permease protein
MNPISLIALNTFRELIRNKVLYAVFAFAFLLIAISALFGSVTIGNQVEVIKDFGLFALTISGAIVVSLSGVTLLERELKQKTIYNLLSKPVRRFEFVLGKFFGLALIGGVVISLMGLVFIAFTAMFEGRIDWLMFQAILFIFLELVILSSVALFFSSLVITTILAGLFTFGTFLAGHSYRALDYFLTPVSEADSAVLSGTVKTLKILLPDLSLFNIADRVTSGGSISLSYLATAILYSIIYSAALLILSILIFQRRDFE